MPSIASLELFIFSLVLSLCTFIFDKLARRTNKNRDSGHFWAFIVTWHTLFLAAFLLYSTWVDFIHPPAWQSGYHLYFDLITASKQNIFWTLLIPCFSWLLFCVFWLIGSTIPAIFSKIKEICLLGGIGYANKRWWVLIFAIILLFIIGIEAKHVVGGENAYPAALWTSLLVISLSLIGLAFSAGKQQNKQQNEPKDPPFSLEPWHTCLKKQGIELKRIGQWKASYNQIETPQSGITFEKWLNHLGAKNIEPLMIEAVGKMVNPPHFHDQHYNQFIASSDNCGQIECVALASQLLQQRFNTTTLLICEKNQYFLKQQLEYWAPEKTIHILNDINNFPTNTGLWIISGEILSAKMYLCDGVFLTKIGLIVWWDLQDYTGVLASNMWAISRRLYRLIYQQGRDDVRTLVFMRDSSFSSAQQASFLQHILPQTFSKEQQTYIPRQLFNNINLYLLEDESPSLNTLPKIENDCRHLALVAAQASIEGYWPTYLAPQSKISNDELSKFSDLPSQNKKTIKDQLGLLPNMANAFIIEVTEQNILALLSIISYLGRNKLVLEDINIGLIAGFNPYIHHLLYHFNEIQFSKFLVSAKASSKITERHLLLALHELPETESQLQRNFLWNEKSIKKILNELLSAGDLHQELIRFLDEKNTLCKEPRYKSKQTMGNRLQPLDTVGSRLIGIRESTAGEHNIGIRMQIDPERLTIKAYPRCIFYFQNQRYRIDDWSDINDIIEVGYLNCRRENMHHHTWRKASVEIDNIKATSPSTGIGNTGLEKCTVTTDYSEILEAVIESQSLDVKANIEKHPLNDIYGKAFSTEAFIVKFPEEQSNYDQGLRSFCYALKSVFPIHLGVRSDAFEIIPLIEETLTNSSNKYENFTGFAIIDLYPQGIGLVHILNKDPDIIRKLFEYTKNWLNYCECDDGCEQCVGTALAYELCDIKPSKKAIINLLTHFI